MEYGLFMMPSHPPERNIYDAHQWDLECLVQADELGYSDKTEIKRLSNFRLNGWNYVDNYHVIIKSSPTRNYLIRFRSTCNDLRHATSIGFKTALGSISRGDKMIIQDMGNWLRDCRVDTIFELTRKPREEDPAE